MNNAGNKMMWGKSLRNFCPVESIEPILDIFALSKLMMPRYDSEVSLKMTPGITRTVPVMIVPKLLGKT